MPAFRKICFLLLVTNWVLKAVPKLCSNDGQSMNIMVDHLSSILYIVEVTVIKISVLIVTCGY